MTVSKIHVSHYKAPKRPTQFVKANLLPERSHEQELHFLPAKVDRSTKFDHKLEILGSNLRFSLELQYIDIYRLLGNLHSHKLLEGSEQRFPTVCQNSPSSGGDSFNATDLRALKRHGLNWFKTR